MRIHRVKVKTLVNKVCLCILSCNSFTWHFARIQLQFGSKSGKILISKYDARNYCHRCHCQVFVAFLYSILSYLESGLNFISISFSVTVLCQGLKIRDFTRNSEMQENRMSRFRPISRGCVDKKHLGVPNKDFLKTMKYVGLICYNLSVIFKTSNRR